MSRKITTAFAAAIITLAVAEPGKAELVVFDASGMLFGGSTLGSTLGSTITIDTTAGTVAAVDLTVTGPTDYTFARFTEAYQDSSSFVIVTNDQAGDQLSFNLGSSTLVGYAGGAIDAGSLTSTQGDDLALFNGSLTAQVSSVPEPSSLALCGIAALAGAGYAWRRRRAV